MGCGLKGKGEVGVFVEKFLNLAKAGSQRGGMLNATPDFSPLFRRHFFVFRRPLLDIFPLPEGGGCHPWKAVMGLCEVLRKIDRICHSPKMSGVLPAEVVL